MTISDTLNELTEAEIEAQVGAYAERLFEVGLASLEAFTISLGRELGLYRHLAGAAVTPPELAERSGIHARYAREWLEQQAASGLIEVEASSADPEARRYALSLAGQECLLRPESLASVGPLFDLLPAVTRVFPTALTDAYRAGTGVPYAAYALHDAQGDFNRPAYVNLLAAEWLPHVPGWSERVAAGPVRAAEIGCGEGWAAISLATAHSNVAVDGFDSDEASIAAARRHAAEAGVSDRAHFEVVDVTCELPARVARDSYDLVMAFEMIHDLARPVEALTTMRLLGKPDAIHLVMDEKVAEKFEAPSENPVERLMYAASVLHCLPVGMADPPSAGTGTVMRPDTFRSYATAAGFGRIDILPIDHDLFRFYHLVP
jgi:2-polyprenyl-3-methyl-5-hydroxy-6-metoxy-1,4-benzoquinol methylase